jgi:hypothetical protein
LNAITPFEASAKDPASIGYPPTLPIEVALKTATPQELKVEYGFSDEEWAALPSNPYFMADLAAAVEMVKKEGMSFKLKARLQAEELLKESWRMIHSKGEEAAPPSVKADLIKSTMRWAGYDNKENAAGTVNNGFSIQINLGG